MKSIISQHWARTLHVLHSEVFRECNVLVWLINYWIYLDDQCHSQYSYANWIFRDWKHNLQRVLAIIESNEYLITELNGMWLCTSLAKTPALLLNNYCLIISPLQLRADSLFMVSWNVTRLIFSLLCLHIPGHRYPVIRVVWDW